MFVNRITIFVTSLTKIIVWAYSTVVTHIQNGLHVAKITFIVYKYVIFSNRRGLWGRPQLYLILLIDSFTFTFALWRTIRFAVTLSFIQFLNGLEVVWTEKALHIELHSWRLSSIMWICHKIKLFFKIISYRGILFFEASHRLIRKVSLIWLLIIFLRNSLNFIFQLVIVNHWLKLVVSGVCEALWVAARIA